MPNPLEHLYRDHHTWLYGWLRSRLKQDCVAADLAQDTFVKLLQHQAHYLDCEQPRALLTTIAKNLTNQWWRRKKIEQAYQDGLMQLDEAYHPSPEQELIVIQALEELSCIISQLQEREKQVFILWQTEARTYADMAQQLNVSVATIKRDMTKIMLCCLTILDLDD